MLTWVEVSRNVRTGERAIVSPTFKAYGSNTFLFGLYPDGRGSSAEKQNKLPSRLLETERVSAYLYQIDAFDRVGDRRSLYHFPDRDPQ